MIYVHKNNYSFYFSCINSILYHLSKSGSGWVGGIKNVYHDPCQDSLDLINMKLTSPFEDCKWEITAPEGHLVTLDFDKIDVSNMIKRN